MNDVIDRLAQLNSPAPPAPHCDEVAGDLERGARALVHRRRRASALASVGLVLAMGGGLAATAVVSRDDAGVPATAAADVGLVAWSGDQPQGFNVAVVPDGFFVQGSDSYVFTVAREGDATHPLSFEDKLVVSLEDSIKPGGQLVGDLVEVAGGTGAIRHSGGATTLEFFQGEHEVVVQMWNSVGLSDEELINFAEGITVTDDARIPGAGSPAQELIHTVIRKGGKKYRKVEVVPPSAE